MANLVLTDAVISVNAVDLTNDCESVDLTYEGDALDATAMSVTGRVFLAGLTQWSVELTFNQDYASSQVDATCFGIVGTSVAIAFKPTSGAISTTNPEYQGNMIVTSYQPLAGSVGEVAKATLSGQGTGTLTRDVTP